MSLAALLKQHIAQNGPVTVAEYMSLCLQHEQFGYYIRNDPFGIKGDFTTSPEISQIFGELIGAWLAGQWLASGQKDAALVEPGPGRGTLMADILRATRHVQGFHQAISVHLVEISPTLKKMQWKTLAGKHERLHWHDSFHSLPKKPLLLVANEFFDALPIHQYRHVSEKGWQERVVALNKEGELGFGWMAAKPPAPLRKLPVSETLYEYSPASHDVMAQVAAHIAQYTGCALVIDYGYVRGIPSQYQGGDTLQAVKAHQFYPVLKEPGTADISAHVDFDALGETAKKAGATSYPPVPQGAFLLRLGAEIRLQALSQNARGDEKNTIISGFERLTSPQEMGDLFKVLCITHPDQPRPDGI